MTEVTTTTTYNLSQVAKLTGFSYEHIYVHVQKGKLPTTRDDNGRHVVQQADLDRLYPVEDRAARVAKFEADRAAEWERNRLAREAREAAPAPTPAAVTERVRGSSIPTTEEGILRMRIEGLKEDLADARKARDDWMKYATMLMEAVTKKMKG